MRAGFIFSEIFWGLLLVVLGLAAILRSFDIHIPIFRLVVAFVLIYLGVTLLMGGTGVGIEEPGTIIFHEARFTGEDFAREEINIIFGSGELDLREVPPGDMRTGEINIVFGSGTIILPEEASVEVKADAVFSSARFPDGGSVTFGEYIYRTPDMNSDDPPDLRLDLNVVFGGVEIIRP